MTRALGHKLFATHGIITTPSITRHYILEDDYFLVLGTDGLWDYIQEAEVRVCVSIGKLQLQHYVASLKRFAFCLISVRHIQPDFF